VIVIPTINPLYL